MTQRSFRQTTCTNCGILGHHFRNCTEPITSYGIIAFRVNQDDWSQPTTILKQDTLILDNTSIEYLCIQRKDSIGYVEIIRSKYKLLDLEYIRQQIAGITEQEKNNLLTKPFIDLWTGLWGPMTAPENRQYRQEFEQARVKFEAFRNGVEIDGTIVSLPQLLQEQTVYWLTPEWGFPKGRRNPQESDLTCAIREFCEETGIHSSNVHILQNCAPIRETFRGNNDVRYCHVYYMAWIPNTISVTLQPTNTDMIREIGNIHWCSYKDAWGVIRHSNPEKREVLQRASKLLRNTLPLLIGPLALPTGQNQASVQIRSRSNNESNGGHIQQHAWGVPGNRESISLFSSSVGGDNEHQQQQQQQQQHDSKPTTDAEWITTITTKPRDRFKRGAFSFVEE